MGMEYSRGMQRDLARLKESPNYREPPEIRGHSFSRLIDDRYESASRQGRAAVLAFGTGICASTFAAIVFWSLRKAPPK